MFGKILKPHNQNLFSKFATNILHQYVKLKYEIQYTKKILQFIIGFLKSSKDVKKGKNSEQFIIYCTSFSRCNWLIQSYGILQAHI